MQHDGRVGEQLRSAAEFEGKRSEGTAQLETDHLVFHGDFRLRIPLKEIRSVASSDGVLRVKFPGGDARFHLGPKADKWANSIRSPKSLLDKLGVKEGMTVGVIGLKDDGFVEELRSHGATVSVGRLRKDSDMIFVAADDRDDLRRLARIEPYIKRNGAVWIVSPKGRPEIRDVVVIEAGIAAGLVDTKVVRFSDALTALKFVIPVARR
jgi:hypothetical protein